MSELTVVQLSGTILCLLSKYPSEKQTDRYCRITLQTSDISRDRRWRAWWGSCSGCCQRQWVDFFVVMMRESLVRLVRIKAEILVYTEVEIVSVPRSSPEISWTNSHNIRYKKKIFQNRHRKQFNIPLKSSYINFFHIFFVSHIRTSTNSTYICTLTPLLSTKKINTFLMNKAWY